MKLKTYKITVEELEDETQDMRIEVEGFSKMELLGLLRTRLQYIEYLCLQDDINNFKQVLEND